MSEFRIGDYTYKVGKLNAKQQLALLRRLGPAIASGIGEIVPLMAAAREAYEASGSIDPGSITATSAFSLIEPAAKALSVLTDEETDYVVNLCMNVVERKPDGGAWARVWNDQAQMSMFSDINDDLSVIIKCVANVVVHNLSNFTNALLSA